MPEYSQSTKPHALARVEGNSRTAGRNDTRLRQDTRTERGAHGAGFSHHVVVAPWQLGVLARSTLR